MKILDLLKAIWNKNTHLIYIIHANVQISRTLWDKKLKFNFF